MTMTFSRRLLFVVLVCAATAWFAGPSGRFLVILPLLLFGPGYLIERALATTASPIMWTRPALWIGLSLSVVALLYQWATALGLAFTTPLLSLLAALCAAGVVWRAWRDTDNPMIDTAPSATKESPGFAATPRSGGDKGIVGFVAHQPFTLSSFRPFDTMQGRLLTLALLAIFALTLWTRFSQARDLALPAWVDSVHHALMIRVTAETGMAPYSLRPYLPVDNLPYHWGYHVFAAAVMQLSGVALPQGMLWSGHLLNALHVITCAALAAYLWRRPMAGIGAGIVVGLLSIFPAYYLSWGRYTQLTGLLMLPALAIAWHAWLRAPALRWQVYVTLIIAGLSLVHFRVLIFALGFMAVAALLWALEQPRVTWLPRLLTAGAMAAAVAVLTIPWLVVLVAQRLAPAVAKPQQLVGGGDYNAFSAGLLWAGQNRLLVALALALALWAVFRRSKTAIEQVGWAGALIVLANPWMVSYLLPAFGALLALWAAQRRHWLAGICAGVLLLLNPWVVRLPYFWLINNEVVIISLFIPLGMLIGGGVALLLEWLEQQLVTPSRASLLPGPEHMTKGSGSAPVPRPTGDKRPFLYRAAFAILAAIALWGTWNSRDVINPTTVLATQADVAALAWVDEHLPADARFLINATSWLDQADRGIDGGWWLLPLTGRWTSAPPALYVYGAPDYVQEIQEVNRTVINFRPDQERELKSLIERERITHIYLGTQPGPLTPAVFADKSAFEKVYERDGVTILAVK